MGDFLSQDVEAQQAINDSFFLSENQSMKEQF